MQFLPLLAFAAPGLAQTLCEQFAYHSEAGYNFNNNVWGSKFGNGSQCTHVDEIDSSGVKWHVDWEWQGLKNNVKSYPYAGRELSEKKIISSISSIPTTADWNYNGDGVRANVAYDLFTAEDPNHDTSHGDFEVMIWLAKLGEIYPIGDSISDVNVDGLDWELYDGYNGDMRVYSFIAPETVNKLDTDIKLFFDHLTTNNGFPADSQHLLILQAGTEPFTGGPATFSMNYFRGEVE